MKFCSQLNCDIKREKNTPFTLLEKVKGNTHIPMRQNRLSKPILHECSLDLPLTFIFLSPKS